MVLTHFYRGSIGLLFVYFLRMVDESLYRERLLQYKELGFNILRVWGGAILEKECFYRLCDEFGLLVWQEFPLSSSGINNTPPDDSERIGRMKDIVDEYILRRHYHPSLVIWSGGNELYDEANEHPLNFEHAMLKACADSRRKRSVPSLTTSFAVRSGDI